MNQSPTRSEPGGGDLFRFCHWTHRGAWIDRHLTPKYVDFFALRIWAGPVAELRWAIDVNPEDSHARALAEWYLGKVKEADLILPAGAPRKETWIPFIDAQATGLKGTKEWAPEHQRDNTGLHHPTEKDGITQRYDLAFQEEWKFWAAVGYMATAGFEFSLVLGSRLQIENLLWEHAGIRGLVLLDNEGRFTPVFSNWPGSEGFLLTPFLEQLNEEEREKVAHQSDKRLIAARRGIADQLRDLGERLELTCEGALLLSGIES